MGKGYLAGTRHAAAAGERNGGGGVVGAAERTLSDERRSVGHHAADRMYLCGFQTLFQCEWRQYAWQAFCHH